MGLGDEEAAKTVITGGRQMAAFRTPALIPGGNGHSRTDKEGNKTGTLILKDCDEDKLLSSLDELQEINPDNVISLRKLEYVTALCK
jgi:hypothetical protein